MKKLMFIRLVTVLSVTLALGIATLHAGQTDSGMIAQNPERAAGYIPQQNTGWDSPNDRAWQRGYRDKAIGLIERGWYMISGMRSGGSGMGSDMRGGGWGMGSGMRGGGWGMGSGMRGGGWGMGSGMRGGGCQ